MKKWLLLLGVLLSSNIHAEQFPLTDFHGGCNTFNSSLSIPDTEVQDCLNVIFDGDTSVQKREGFILNATTTTVTFTNSVSFIDANSNRWIITLASDSIRAQQSNGNFSVLIATVPITPVSGTTAFNKVWFVDQVQGVYSWDGTTTIAISGSPKGRYIDKLRNRLAVAGLLSPNQSQVYLSKFLDGTTWTSGTLATDPVIITAGLQDNSDVITGLFGGYNDTLIIFKRQSIWGLFGADQTDFAVKVLSTESGTVDSRSVQPLAGGLIFASLRGIEYFNGSVSVIISDKIRNKLDALINSAFSYKTWAQTSQADFTTGTISPTNSLNLSITPDNIVLSSQVAFSVTDTAWNSGTSVSVDSTTNSPNLQLSRSSAVDYTQTTTSTSDETWCTDFFMCTTGARNMAQSFTTSSGAQQLTSVELYLSKGGAPGDSTLRLKTDNAGVPGTDILTVPILASSLGTSGAFVSFSFTPTTLTPSTKYWLYVDNTGNKTSANFIKWFAVTPASGQQEWNSCSCNGTSGLVNGTLAYKVHITALYTTVGTFTSQTFDVGTDTTTYLWAWSTFGSNFTGPGLTFQTKVSSASTGTYDALVTASTGAVVPSATKRFVKYIATFSGDGTTTPVLSNVSLATTQMIKSSGTYYSAVNFAPNISLWDIFTANKIDNSGTQTFYLRASTNSFTVLSSTPSWTAVTNNSVISVATGTYMQFRDDFIVTAATQNPTLQDFALNFYEGVPPPAMTSVVFDDRYYLSLTTSTLATANDATLVLGRHFDPSNPVWTIWDLKTGTFLYHLGRLYHGNNTGNGKWYQDGGVFSDDGVAINSFVKTKDYALTDITVDKYMTTLYLYAENAGNYPITTLYYLDKASTGYSLSTVLTNESGGFMNLKLPFPIASSNANFGKTISFKFSNTVTDNQMKLMGGVLVYTPAKLIK